MAFKPAYREQVRLRLAIMGPGKTGKTFTSMALAASMANEIRKRGGEGRIAVADSERESAKLYAMSRSERAKYNSIKDSDEAYEYIKLIRKFPIDVQQMTPPYSTHSYIEVMEDAAREGYDITILDSITHCWAGAGGVLDRKANIERAGKANSWTAWATITPEQDAFVDAMLSIPTHLIATIRMKVTHEIQKNETTGKNDVVEIGLEEIQRSTIRYEFTAIGTMDHSHTLTVVGSRLDGVLTAGDTFAHPGESLGRKIYGWVNDGDAPAPAVERPSRVAAAREIDGGDSVIEAALVAMENADDFKSHLPGLKKLGEQFPGNDKKIRERYTARKNRQISSAVNIDIPVTIERNPPTGTNCSVCGEPQVFSPSGITCKFGHGGADAKDLQAVVDAARQV